MVFLARKLVVSICVVLTGAWLAACDTQIGKDTQSKSASSASASSNSLPTDRNPSEKIDIASEPVPLGGSYLACQLKSTNNLSSEVSVLCQASAPDTKRERAEAAEFKFSHGTRKDDAQLVSYSSQLLTYDSQNQRWEWEFTFSRASFTGPLLFAQFIDRSLSPGGGSPSGDDRSISVEVSVIEVQVQFLLNAKTLIGDSSNAALPENIPATLTDCLEVPSNLKPKSSPLGFVFEVTSAQAAIQVTMNGVCGISNTSNNLNKLQIIDERGQLIKGEFGLQQSTPTQSFSLSNLPKGTYKLVLTSNIDNTGEADDFIVDDIQIQATQGLLKVH